jgi:DNA-binding GntR family transcriptional regulator
LEAQGVYQVRAELEGLAAELFTEHATLEQKRALERGFVELEKAVNGKDQLAIFAARRSFYDSLVDGSGNLALAQTLQALNSRMTVLRASALSALSQSNESLQDLRRLVDAVFEMDKDKARQAARDHVANVAALTIRFLVEREVSANSKEPSRRTG